MQDPFSLVGTSFEARYQIDSVIGEGGFGVVYRGTHLRFDHPIAVKCLKIPSHFTADAKAIFLQRFKEEGKILLKLGDAPGVPRVYDYGIHTVDKHEIPYLVMEWLAGQTLEEAMDRRRKSGAKNLQPSEAIALMLPVIEAIALAHENNIAHRDIKPANLFLATNGRTPVVKVLDFGIAKAMQEGESLAQSQAKTQTSFRAFTPNYAAAEQFTPKRFGASGPWTDVNALGLVLVELLTGKPANPGDDFVECLEFATSQQRPSPQGRGAEVSDELEAVVLKAVALKADDRYPNARALAGALKSVPEATNLSGSVTVVPETDDEPPLTIPPATDKGGGTEIIAGTSGDTVDPKVKKQRPTGTVISETPTGTPTGTKLVTEQPVMRDKTEIAGVKGRGAAEPAPRSPLLPIAVGVGALAVGAIAYLSIKKDDPTPAPASSSAVSSQTPAPASSSASTPAPPAAKEVLYAQSFFATSEVIAVLPMDEAAAKGTLHYRLTKEGGKVVLVEKLDPTGGVQQSITFSYPASGGWERVEKSGRGVLQKTMRYTKDNVETQLTRGGSPFNTGCARLAYKLSPAGDPMERVCQDPGGNTIIDANGCQVLKLEHNDKHQAQSMGCFQYDGKPIADANGIHLTRFTYDERGNIIEHMFFDAQGGAAASSEGCFRLRNEYDQANNKVGLTCIGTSGLPTAIRGSKVGGLKIQVDQRGCQTKVQYFDPEGAPAKMGMLGAYVTEVDAYCEELGRELQDDKGALIALGSPPKIRRKLDDEGKVLEKSCFDVNRSLVNCELDDKLGAAGSIIRYEYDDKGRVIGARAFDASGKPTVTSRSYPHYVKTTYDSLGLPVEVAYFDESGAPSPSLGNVAKRSERFDPLGSPVSQRSFGVDGQPVVDSTKTHEIRQAYDDLHRLVRIEARDAAGEYPATTALSFNGVSWPTTAARVEIVREGAKLENRFYDKNGKEVSKVDCTSLETRCYR
jgi:serine/threonine protein kinase